MSRTPVRNWSYLRTEVPEGTHLPSQVCFRSGWTKNLEQRLPCVFCKESVIQPNGSNSQMVRFCSFVRTDVSAERQTSAIAPCCMQTLAYYGRRLFMLYLLSGNVLPLCASLTIAFIQDCRPVYSSPQWTNIPGSQFVSMSLLPFASPGLHGSLTAPPRRRRTLPLLLRILAWRSRLQQSN